MKNLFFKSIIAILLMVFLFWLRPYNLTGVLAGAFLQWLVFLLIGKIWLKKAVDRMKE